MRSLRYWLGLPLYNLILLAFCVCYVHRMGLEDIYYRASNWIMLSIAVCPFLTALYYPVRRADCRPLWKPVLYSSGAIFIICLSALFLMCPTLVNYWIILAALLALAEAASYALGLLAVWLAV